MTITRALFVGFMLICGCSDLKLLYFSSSVTEMIYFREESMRIIQCVRNRVNVTQTFFLKGEFTYSHEAGKPLRSFRSFGDHSVNFVSKVKNYAGSVHPSHAVPGGFHAGLVQVHTLRAMRAFSTYEMRFPLISSTPESETRCTRHRNTLYDDIVMVSRFVCDTLCSFVRSDEISLSRISFFIQLDLVDENLHTADIHTHTFVNLQ